MESGKDPLIVLEKKKEVCSMAISEKKNQGVKERDIP